MRTLILAALVAAGGCAAQPHIAPPQAASACPVEQALYRIRGAPEASWRFVATPHALNAFSDLAAQVDFEGETYWFAFSASQGYSRNYIGRTVDPFEAAALVDAGEDPDPLYAEPEYNGSELHLFDAAFDAIENIPQRGDPAPAHILATGVSSAIWYSVPRRELPKAMWDYVDCVDDLG